MIYIRRILIGAAMVALGLVWVSTVSPTPDRPFHFFGSAILTGIGFWMILVNPLLLVTFGSDR